MVNAMLSLLRAQNSLLEQSLNVGDGNNNKFDGKAMLNEIYGA